ncbi:uncharacterized protein LOC120125059 [Hibiscus syriacus]|uniref:uncharacterized protein LOC120125059 n=1 Tax=Hibiscus syriacus TaxID=106335 RepID=UPI0019215110|nr:uncharacterized protein LOC120125059 [Hibiscus syriacus]
MNVFSKLLDLGVKEGIFIFHPKCKRIGLTHRCFADDLIIISRGSLDSVCGIKCVLDIFHEMYGFWFNATKSDLFVSGVSEIELAKICECNGFKLGRLPVRYLVVPLVIRKLGEKDYQGVIEKIRSMLN